MIRQAAQQLYQNAADCRQQGQVALYGRALERGRRGQIWSGLTGRSRALLSLAEVIQPGAVQSRSSRGTRTVAIAQIRGSESRVADFDCDFNPLHTRTRERWLDIAAAQQRGRCLPPVALVQVGDRYFVRDGHHRISVVRALGQKTIEATVEIWQPDKPLPREQRTPASSSAVASILRWLSAMQRPADGAGACPVGR